MVQVGLAEPGEKDGGLSPRGIRPRGQLGEEEAARDGRIRVLHEKIPAGGPIHSLFGPDTGRTGIGKNRLSHPQGEIRTLGLGPAVEEGGQLLPAHRLVGAKGGGGQTCHNPGFPSPVHCLGIPGVSWDVQKRAGLARLGGSGQPPQKGGRHGPVQGSLGPEGVRGDPLHQVTVLGVLDAQGIPGGGSHVGKGGLPCRGGLDADQGKAQKNRQQGGGEPGNVGFHRKHPFFCVL